MESLKVSIVQTSIYWEDPQANLAMLTKKIEELPQTNLIVLPEMFTTGFSMNAEKYAEQPSGNGFKWMQQQAKQTKAAIVGSIMVKEDENYHNRLYFVYPNGDFITYNKRHLFSYAGEDTLFTAGQEQCIIDYLGWKFCLQICYDLRFPIWSRNTQGYDVLLYVASWPAKRIKAWDSLLPARAIENMAYVIGVNRVGVDGKGYLHNGHSVVYNCLGEAMLPITDIEQLTTLSLAKTHLEETRKKFPFLNDADKFTVM